jgi:hypothetical protein
MQQNTTTDCTHESVAERALVGTWVVDEVSLAVDKGYRLIEVYEFFEYDVTQFDPATGEGGLFVQHINTFLKLKAEASGYPTWVRTPDDEDRFVQSFHDSEGILLNKDAIRPNAAKRALAKVCLNVGQTDGTQ